jgi:pyrimidine-nucleoside phosphorylase
MDLQITQLIRIKQSGKAHTRAEIEALIRGYLSGAVHDYHMAAWLMAVFFQGMDAEETQFLVESMWHSGATLPRSDRNDFWVDKHSTGGVGDKTSLILVPLVTAVSQKMGGPGKLKIPMISGRGLDFTGGTLDKLESVPGFSSNVALTEALPLLEKNGFFMLGQTQELAPADRLLYALRDVTSTVECKPLIVSSILAKKLAENLDGLVLDVKFGSGAFMKDLAAAKQLGLALAQTAVRAGVKAVSVLTRMDEPLGWKVGHQLEVEECADYLRGESREPGLHSVTLELAAQMLVLWSRGKLALTDAKHACESVLGTSEPFRLFVQMFESQGGRWAEFEANREKLKKRRRVPVRASSQGYLAKVDSLAIARLVRALGGGRQSKETLVDLEVGVEMVKKVGDAVEKGEIVYEVILSDRSTWEGFQAPGEDGLKIEAKKGAKADWVAEVVCAE